MLIVYLAAFYIVSNLFGILIKKIRIPKIYAALFLGVFLSGIPQITEIVNTDPINLLSQAGMVSLLLLLGYGLNLKSLLKQGKLITKITVFVIVSGATVGATVLHFFFGVEWILAGVVGLSFSTVGEEALLPLLKEFKILKTELGQTIMGVAILDDLVEIASFILLISLFGNFRSSELLSESIPLIAIASGILLGNLNNHSEKIEEKINFIALYVFGPIFFFTAGAEAQLSILINNFWVILAFTLVIKATKLISSYAAAHKELGTKKSIVLGLSLCIKFSTSIIILIILLKKGLISEEIFTILIGIKVLFKFIVPILLTYLFTKWRLHLVDMPVSKTQKRPAI